MCKYIHLHFDLVELQYVNDKFPFKYEKYGYLVHGWSGISAGSTVDFDCDSVLVHIPFPLMYEQVAIGLECEEDGETLTCKNHGDP